MCVCVCVCVCTRAHCVCVPTIFRIIAAIIVFFAVGALIQYKVKGARGIEVIPNILFWRDLPFLIKVGIALQCTLLNIGLLSRHARYYYGNWLWKDVDCMHAVFMYSQYLYG